MKLSLFLTRNNRISIRCQVNIGNSLLDLVAAVGARVADNELQFLPSILHKLPLERSLLRSGGPGEALVDIEQPIKAKRESNQPPTHSLPHLRKHKKNPKSHNHRLRMMLAPNNDGQSSAKSAHYTQMEDQRRKQVTICE